MLIIVDGISTEPQSLNVMGTEQEGGSGTNATQTNPEDASNTEQPAKKLKTKKKKTAISSEEYTTMTSMIARLLKKEVLIDINIMYCYIYQCVSSCLHLRSREVLKHLVYTRGHNGRESWRYTWSRCVILSVSKVTCKEELIIFIVIMITVSE